jgi:hypothetical protein
VTEAEANLGPGGPRNNRLFIAAPTNVFAALLNVGGLNYPFMGRAALL